jgi:hypothetical protein
LVKSVKSDRKLGWERQVGFHSGTLLWHVHNLFVCHIGGDDVWYHKWALRVDVDFVESRRWNGCWARAGSWEPQVL